VRACVRACLCVCVCVCAGVEHGLIPATTQVKPSPSATFQQAGSFTTITAGLTMPPLSGTGTRDDEAHDRTESSMAKQRPKRTTRTLPSKRGPGSATPRKLKRPDDDLTAGSPPSTPKGRSSSSASADRSWLLPAVAVCAVAAGVSTYLAWHGSSNMHEQ
jgi:hypothetical protein